MKLNREKARDDKRLVGANQSQMNMISGVTGELYEGNIDIEDGAHTGLLGLLCGEASEKECRSHYAEQRLDSIRCKANAQAEKIRE